MTFSIMEYNYNYCIIIIINISLNTIMRSSFLNERKGKVYFSGKNESDNGYLWILALPELWSIRDPWWDFPAARAIEERRDDASPKTGRRFWSGRPKWNLNEREHQRKSLYYNDNNSGLTDRQPTAAICRQLRAISWPWRHRTTSQHFRRVRSWLGLG